MAMRNIKMMVKDKVVRLKFYREGERFYETECGFVFPCPCRTWVMRPFWLKIRLYFFYALHSQAFGRFGSGSGRIRIGDAGWVADQGFCTGALILTSDE